MRGIFDEDDDDLFDDLFDDDDCIEDGVRFHDIPVDEFDEHEASVHCPCEPCLLDDGTLVHNRL